MTTMPTTEKALLTTEDAARMLGLSNQYLRRLRYEGKGPEFLKIRGVKVRYRLADLIGFAQQTGRAVSPILDQSHQPAHAGAHE